MDVFRNARARNTHVEATLNHPFQARRAELARRLVVAEPEVQFDAVGESDEFLLLACDGLFDVFSDAEAVAFVRGELADHGDPQRAAERVTNAAIVDRGTRDNVSVIVVKLT